VDLSRANHHAPVNRGLRLCFNGEPHIGRRKAAPSNALHRR
jgi:hypothetical protein